ncbi:flippase [Thiomicrorhabdus hydrogeniphila]
MLTKLQSLKNHNGFIRYFKNTSWMMAEQFLRILAGLFVGIWVARYLGPEQFGLFSYVLAFTAIFGGIAKLGLDGIMVRELVNHPEKRDVYLGTAFWLKVIGAFIVMALMAAIVPFTSNDTTTNTFIFIIAAGLVFQSFEVVEFYFQSQVLAKIVSICKVIQLVLSSVIKIYLVLTGADLIWFVLVTAFDAFSLAVSYFIAYKLCKNPAFYKYFDLSSAKQLLKDSWPMIFTLLATMVYMKVDQIMINELLGSREVGLYAASVRIYEAWLIIPFTISMSLLPAIVKRKSLDRMVYERDLSRLFAFVFWLSITVAIFVSFTSQIIIDVTFGPNYKESAMVLILIIWAGAFSALGSVSARYLTVENKAKKLAVRMIVAMSLNVVLNYILLPIYGIEGAAIATLVSLIVANYFMNYFDKDLNQLAKVVNRALIMKVF